MPKKLSSIQDFLFSAPLYAEYDLAPPEEEARSSLAWELFSEPLVVDGHCLECGRVSTFRRTTPRLEYDDITRIEEKHVEYVRMVITCARDQAHEIIFLFRTNNLIIQKIGQYPSLADIANDESRHYRQVLEQHDRAELHRAIGLAAHGVGVGSFVYLRRVFERLLTRRFNEFKDAEGWNADDFVDKRIGDQIALLQQHLPDFLVRNKKV